VMSEKRKMSNEQVAVSNGEMAMNRAKRADRELCTKADLTNTLRQRTTTFFIFSLFSFLLFACNPMGSSYEEIEEKLGLHNCTVTFNSGEGTPAPDQIVKKGKMAAEPQGVTLAGYTLDGWYKEPAFTNQWDFAVNTVIGNITLYAKWSENPSDTFTITFYSNGGSTVASQFVHEGERVNRPPDPTRAGWAFANWYVDYECTTAYNFSTPVTSNLNLYASWVDTSRSKYTVTFYSNEGSDVDSQSVYEGERVVRPDDPTRAGHVFVNWYADTNFNVVYQFTAPVTRHIDIYARWVPATVTFDRNSGDTEANPRTITLTPPPPTVGNLPAPPLRAGYTFTGWNTQANGTGAAFTTAVTVYGNITVYAQWNPITYYVAYNANGGTGTMNPNPSSHIYDIENALTANVFTRTGYTFDGWNTQTDGQGTDYADGQSVKNLTAMAGATVTLYAKWVAGIILEVNQIIDGAPIIATITISQTGNGYPTIFTVSVNADDFDAGSIAWEVAGVGVYAGQTVTGSGASFTLDATEVKYNSPGGHVLTVTVTKNGSLYQRAIQFSIIP